MIYQFVTSTQLRERREMGWFHMFKEVQSLPRIRTDLSSGTTFGAFSVKSDILLDCACIVYAIKIR